MPVSGLGVTLRLLCTVVFVVWSIAAMSAHSNGVPCLCSLCNGQLVSPYLRRQHTKKLVLSVRGYEKVGQHVQVS